LYALKIFFLSIENIFLFIYDFRKNNYTNILTINKFIFHKIYVKKYNKIIHTIINKLQILYTTRDTNTTNIKQSIHFVHKNILLYSKKAEYECITVKMSYYKTTLNRFFRNDVSEKYPPS